jgi:hypothetical protein
MKPKYPPKARAQTQTIDTALNTAFRSRRANAAQKIRPASPGDVCHGRGLLVPRFHRLYRYAVAVTRLISAGP